MKTFLKGFFILFSFLVLIGVVGLFVVWTAPQVLINTKNLERLKPYLLERGISWADSSLKLEARSEAFFKKRFVLDAENFCLSQENQKYCFEKIDFISLVDLGAFSLQSLNVERLIVSAKNLTLDLRAKKEEKKISPKDKEKGLDLGLLAKIELGLVDLSFPSLNMILDKNKIVSSFYLKNNQKDGISLKSGVQLPEERYLHVDLAKRGEILEESLIQGELSYKDPQTRVLLDLKFIKKDQKLDLLTSGTLSFAKFFKKPLKLERCQLQALLSTDHQSLIRQAELNCGLRAQTRHLLVDHRYLKLFPRSVGAHLTAFLKTEGRQEDMKGWINLEVAPELNSFFEGILNARYLIDFANKDQKAKIDLNSDLKITDFKTFAALMNSIGLLVPSPVNVLKGKVQVKLDGEIDVKPLNGLVRVSLLTDLKSTDQALDLKAEGDLKLSPCVSPQDNMNFELDLVATEMKLKLPNIDYKNPPALVPDSRFVDIEDLEEKKPDKKAGCGFNYKIVFKNKEVAPILISGPLLKNDLPLKVNVIAEKGKKARGSVRVDDFSTELFRRKTVVQNFNLDLETQILTGLIRVDYTDYKIFIHLSGTAKSVRVGFESDPPLDRQQVLAILLFGKPLEGLDEGQSGSVENMDAAAKDGALSLASLYLFASTPIESVGYNPHTQGLTAKVKLASGTTLNVGANEEGLTDLGVTRRLSKHWRIQTTVKDPTEEGERSASTLLEWFTRF